MGILVSTPTVVGAMRQRQRGDGNVSRGQSPATSVATMVSGDEIIEDGGDHRHPQEEVPQHARPSQAARDPVYNMDGREVGRPYAYRDDVGAVGILTGNWGGHRANVATQAAMDLDLKSGPATIICLQEAHEGVAHVLAEPVPPPPPAVAGNGGEDRPQAQYYTLRANENCNTNFIAVRVNLASELTSVRFQRTVDGFYRLRK